MFKTNERIRFLGQCSFLLIFLHSVPIQFLVYQNYLLTKQLFNILCTFVLYCGIITYTYNTNI